MNSNFNTSPSHHVNYLTSAPPTHYPNTEEDTETDIDMDRHDTHINASNNAMALLQDGIDELAPMANGYGSILMDNGDVSSSISSDKEKGKNNKKLKKKQTKQNQDTLKFDMGQERTFFKWLRTGMQVGAIGTFVFIALDHKRGSPLGVATVAFAWLVGFIIVLYGLWSYYARREALRSGSLPAIPEYIRHHAPAFVVIALIAVVCSALAYAAFANPDAPKLPPRVPYPTTSSPNSATSDTPVSGVMAAQFSLNKHSTSTHSTTSHPSRSRVANEERASGNRQQQ